MPGLEMDNEVEERVCAFCFHALGKHGPPNDPRMPKCPGACAEESCDCEHWLEAWGG